MVYLVWLVRIPVAIVAATVAGLLASQAYMRLAWWWLGRTASHGDETIAT